MLKKKTHHGRVAKYKMVKERGQVNQRETESCEVYFSLLKLPEYGRKFPLHTVLLRMLLQRASLFLLQETTGILLQKTP